MSKKIIGIGNALADIMVKMTDESFLQKFNLPKGSMQLVDLDFTEKIINGSQKLEISLAMGGSAANTIHGLARLGIDSAFIGKVGNDEYGEIFKDNLLNSLIDAKLLLSNKPTGRAVALVSPDSERTFATYLGAAVEITPKDITPGIFSGYNYIHIEGYLVHDNKLFEHILSTAKNAGLTVSLDLASYNVVDMHKDFLIQMVKKYVDVLFANEEEAKSITGKLPADALNVLSGMCDIAIVKIGEKGSMIKMGEDQFNIGIEKVKCIDTTGAGDLYASGFLYGLASGHTLDKCGKAGALLSSRVIENMGAKIKSDNWDDILNKLKKI